MASDNDDRVAPMHSYKFAAELQHKNRDNPAPLLCSIERNTGHGGALTFAWDVPRVAA